jgi:hypothetical protein
VLVTVRPAPEHTGTRAHGQPSALPVLTELHAYCRSGHWQLAPDLTSIFGCRDATVPHPGPSVPRVLAKTDLYVSLVYRDCGRLHDAVDHQLRALAFYRPG